MPTNDEQNPHRASENTGDDDVTGVRFTFAHRRLDVYQMARRLAADTRRVADGLSRADRKIADQLHRAAIGIPMLIAEGANRRHPREKRQKYNEALGEAAEVASALDVIMDAELTDPAEAHRLTRLAERIGAMLRALIKYEERRIRDC